MPSQQDPTEEEAPDPRFIMPFHPSAREYLPAMGEQIVFMSIGDVWCSMIRCSRNGAPLKMAIKKLKQYHDDELADLPPL